MPLFQLSKGLRRNFFRSYAREAEGIPLFAFFKNRNLLKGEGNPFWRKVEMKTPASLKGHPLHPILVTFPIALWIFSLARDIIALAGLGRTEVWEPIAFYTMAGGIAGALLAALPGLVDLLSTQDPRVKRIGVVHMCINVLVVCIFGADWGMRFAHATGPVGPFILSIIGVALMCVGGWLGANLVHRFGVTIEGYPAPA